MHGMFFFLFFVSFLFFLFTAYLRTTTTTKLCHDDNNTHGPQDTKGGDGDEEMGPKWWNGVSSFVPLVCFFYRFFLILFIIRTRDASCVLGLFFYITTSNNGLKMHQNASQDPSPPFLPYLLRAQGPRHVSGLVLFLLFFSSPQSSRHVSGFVFSFLFSFLFSFSIILFYWLLFTGLFFQILKLQHLDDMSGTQKGSSRVSSPVCLFFFLQSNFFLLKIIYIEITYGHKHEWLHHPHYKGLNDTSRCVIWAKSRFFFNSLGFLHTN